MIKKVIVVLTILFLMVISSHTMLASRNVITKNALNPAPEQTNVNGGIESELRFKITEENGLEHYSSKSSLSYSKERVDLIESDVVQLVGKIKNPTANPININYVLTLPYYANQNTNSLVDETKVVINGDNSSIVTKPDTIRGNYSTVAGRYRPLSTLVNEGFTFDKLKAIQFTGSLKPNEEIEISIPFKITSNVDNISMPAEWLIFVPEYTRNSITLVTSKPLYNVEEKMYGKFAGAYRYTQEDGSRIYRKVPKYIQEIMPDVTSDQFLFTRDVRLYYPGRQVDLSHTSDKIAYSDSTFAIHTDKIFNAIKDEGFTTYADTTRGLWNAYVYSMTSGLRFFDDAGEEVVLGQEDSDQILLSPFYVELHKIFETKTIIINENESWDHFDNLVIAQDIIAQGSDQATPLSKDVISVEHNVDNTKKGTYFVKYKYEVAPDKVVTKTDKVIVLGKYDVNYEFVSEDQTQTLPKEVLELLPQSKTQLAPGTKISVDFPTKLEIETQDGIWKFISYNVEEIEISSDDIKVAGIWKFEEKETPTNDDSTKVEEKEILIEDELVELEEIIQPVENEVTNVKSVVDTSNIVIESNIWILIIVICIFSIKKLNKKA